MAREVDPETQEINTLLCEVVEEMKLAGTLKEGIDVIAYTKTFDAIYNRVEEMYPEQTRNSVWRKLLNLRKKGFKVTRMELREQRSLDLSQIRILKTLAMFPGGLNKQQLSEKAMVPTSLIAVLGLHDTAKLTERERELGKTTLIGQGLVESEVIQNDNGRDTIVYRITDTGLETVKDISQNRKKKEG